jgi:hypothetical protein
MRLSEDASRAPPRALKWAACGQDYAARDGARRYGLSRES